MNLDKANEDFEGGVEMTNVAPVAQLSQHDLEII